MNKRGRPKKEEKLNKKLYVRMTENDYEKLIQLSILHDTPVAEIARKGIQMNMNLMKNGVNL